LNIIFGAKAVSNGYWKHDIRMDDNLLFNCNK